MLCISEIYALCVDYLKSFLYSDNLHSLVRNTVRYTALLPFSYVLLIDFCQKYLPSERILGSEEGHFSSLEVGVNFFQNLLFCIFPLNNVIKFFGCQLFIIFASSLQNIDVAIVRKARNYIITILR